MKAANPVRRGIQLVGLLELARRRDVKYQAVRKGETKRIPAERVLAFESATRGQVPRYGLLPDLQGEHLEQASMGEMWAGR